MIEPDPDAADIVRTIFGMAVEGVGITAIVRYLNEQAVPTPIQYARNRGLEGNYNEGNGLWNTRSVKYILTNRTYTGALVQGKEKRVVEGSHTPLVDTKAFDSIQTALQKKAFNISTSDTAQRTENILKGKVICGCCGSKMQRRRGTNHADWYFFTCLTNNRVGADRCTGMYIREEDIFNAIYHQLKLYLQSPGNSIYQSKQYLGQLHRKSTEQIELQRKIAENPMMHYEKYILGEITIDEFRAGQDKIRQMAEDQKVLEFEIEKCDRACQHLLCMCEVRDKQLPLSAILEEIKTITVCREKNCGALEVMVSNIRSDFLVITVYCQGQLKIVSIRT